MGPTILNRAAYHVILASKHRFSSIVLLLQIQRCLHSSIKAALFVPCERHLFSFNGGGEQHLLLWQCRRAPFSHPPAPVAASCPRRVPCKADIRGGR